MTGERVLAARERKAQDRRTRSPVLVLREPRRPSPSTFIQLASRPRGAHRRMKPHGRAGRRDLQGLAPTSSHDATSRCGALRPSPHRQCPPARCERPRPPSQGCAPRLRPRRWERRSKRPTPGRRRSEPRRARPWVSSVRPSRAPTSPCGRNDERKRIGDPIAWRLCCRRLHADVDRRRAHPRQRAARRPSRASPREGMERGRSGGRREALNAPRHAPRGVSDRSAKGYLPPEELEPELPPLGGSEPPSAPVLGSISGYVPPSGGGEQKDVRPGMSDNVVGMHFPSARAPDLQALGSQAGAPSLTRRAQVPRAAPASAPQGREQ